MRTLSGIQTSGRLHLGNYFGSMKPNLDLVSKSDESVYFIADLHALTTIHNPKELAMFREEALIDYLAIGFDPEKTIIFYQSDVPLHTELMWILLSCTPMGLLERAVSYKEKVEKGIPASAGLFTYPVLMAADILLYNADRVPVGKDQKQHLEMTRDIAQKFNQAFGETFTLPEPVIMEDVAVVPGIDGQKMSKSYGNTIPLFGDDAAIKKSIMGIVTDSKGVEEPKDPDSNVIFQLHRLFLSSAEQKKLAEKYRNGGLGYGDAKKMLLETYMDFMKPMREKREKISKDKKYLEKVRKEGAEKALHLAEKTMVKVRKAVGLQ
jgi:tryptophanyl-tRNA synthetase